MHYFDKSKLNSLKIEFVTSLKYVKIREFSEILKFEKMRIIEPCIRLIISVGSDDVCAASSCACVVYAEMMFVDVWNDVDGCDSAAVCAPGYVLYSHCTSVASHIIIIVIIIISFYSRLSHAIIHIILVFQPQNISFSPILPSTDIWHLFGLLYGFLTSFCFF